LVAVSEATIEVTSRGAMSSLEDRGIVVVSPPRAARLAVEALPVEFAFEPDVDAAVAEQAASKSAAATLTPPRHASLEAS
jgi:hypothetical protein